MMKQFLFDLHYIHPFGNRIRMSKMQSGHLACPGSRDHFRQNKTLKKMLLKDLSLNPPRHLGGRKLSVKQFPFSDKNNAFTSPLTPPPDFICRYNQTWIYFSICASSAIVYPYLGEFYSESKRSSSIIWMCVFIALGISTTPGNIHHISNLFKEK